MRSFVTAALFLILAPWTLLHAQHPGNKPMPREDVVEVPAIGDGLCVSNVFQSHMVIQRDKPVAVWGWADPGESVTVAFAGDSAKAVAAADRSWKVMLRAVTANADPQVMTISTGRETLRLEDILVGDVWILGGQSNMEFEIAKVDDGIIEIASANFPAIRLLTMPQGKGFHSVKSFERLHEWSDWSDRHFRKGDWLVCTPENVKEFSAIGYVFGRRIHMASRVPVGLIDASIGGTTVETWTPEDVMRSIDGAETRAKLREWDEKIAAFDPQADLKQQIANYEARKKRLEASGQKLPPDSKPPAVVRPGPVADRNRPGHCYAGVIRPLEGLSACGIVFHQGFNNCFEGTAGARMYYQVFGRMIAAWRAAFGDARMPFGIISLPTAGAPQTVDRFVEPMHDAGPLIREAQYRTFRDLRAAGDTTIGYASSFDFRKSWYHPQIKIPAGERAAKWAMATHYKLLGGRDADSCWLPPVVEKSEVKDGKLVLTMSTDITTRDDSDGRLLGFAIAGEDRRFFPAEISYLVTGTSGNKQVEDRKVLVLGSPHVPAPVHYRHAWARNPMTNMTSARHIPIPTLRSDDWPMEETPKPRFDPPADNPRALSNLINRELKLADTERRINEARRTIEQLEPSFLKEKEVFEKEMAKQAQKRRGAAPR